MPSQKQATTRPNSSHDSSTRPSTRSASASPAEAVRTPTRPAAGADRARRGGSSPAGSGPSAPRESAFSAHFLERIRRRDAEARSAVGEGLSDTDLARRAHWVGPWEVERVKAGPRILHAVVRRAEPAREGGGARLACLARQESLLGTAAFAAVAVPNRLTVNTESRSPHGLPIHDGGRHIGHLSPSARGVAEELVASFHAVRCLAANPDALALLVEALDGETLALLGRAIMRRLA